VFISVSESRSVPEVIDMGVLITVAIYKQVSYYSSKAGIVKKIGLEQF